MCMANRPIRNALESVRAETDTISRSHQQLAQSIRKEVDTPLSEFIHRAEGTRRPSLLAVEKLHRHKAAQVQYVARAREKYEHDCTKVNAYTAQSNLVQGRDLDKLMMKLERVQATVGGNDADYQSYVQALQDTTQKWNAEWKSYLDICQDIEEDRQDFLKNNLWNLANAVSTVCVSDDEACERVRVTLEGCDATRDVNAFAVEFGTGSAIPAAPEYINYAQGQVHPTAPEFETAQFERLSTRSGGLIPVPTSTHLGPRSPLPTGRSPSPAARTPPPVGRTPPPMSRTASSFQSVPSRHSIFAPGGPPVSPRPHTPRQQTPRVPPPSLPQEEDPNDPITKALANLRVRQSRKSPAPGSRPTSLAMSEPAESAPIPAPESARGADIIPDSASRQMPSSAAALATAQAPAQPAQPAYPPAHPELANAPAGMRHSMPPSSSMSDPRMFHRPTSPSAAFMQAPARAPSPLAFDRVVSNYGQAFPSERRGQSPTKNAPAPQRTGTPLGIALDAHGSVTQDEMADNYVRAPSAVYAEPSAPMPGGFSGQPAADPVPVSAYESQTMPPPTGQYSDSGQPILFYGECLLLTQ